MASIILINAINDVTMYNKEKKKVCYVIPNKKLCKTNNV